MARAARPGRVVGVGLGRAGRLSLLVAGALLAGGTAAFAQQTIQITATADDAYERTSVIYYLSNCGAGTDPCPVRLSTASAGGRHPGLRFPGVNLPKGAFVTSATLEAYVLGTTNDDFVGTIYGHATDNAPDFVTLADVDGRPRTAARVALNQVDWGVGWKSIDVTSLVQEIVNRSGWTSGNALALLIIGLSSGAGYNGDFDSVDTAPANAPRLTVNYSGTAEAVLEANPKGQPPDQLDERSTVPDVPLLRFRFRNIAAGAITIDQVVFDLTSVSGIASGDLSSLRIRHGTADWVTGGVASIAGATGTVTFDGNWTLQAGTMLDFELWGTAANLVAGDRLTVSLAPTGFTLASGVAGGVTLTGSPHTAGAGPPLVVFSDLSGIAPRPLQYSVNSAGSWSAAATAIAGGGAGQPLHQKAAVLGPDRNLAAALFIETSGARDNLYATFFDTASWDNGSGAPLGDAQDLSLIGWDGVFDVRQADVAWEEKSGRALAVAGINTVNSVKWWRYSPVASPPPPYGTWTGGTIATVQTCSPSSHVFHHVKLASGPGTNRIAFVGIGVETATYSPTFSTIQAAIWDGDAGAWTNGTSFTACGAGSVLATDAIGVKFVLGGTNAGEAVAVGANGTRLLAKVWRPGTGWTATSTVFDLGGVNNIRWLRLAAEPDGRRMVLALLDDARRILTATYDGNTRAWSAASPAHTTTAYGNPAYNRPFDVVWDTASGADNVQLVFSDDTGIYTALSSNGGGLFNSPTLLDATGRAWWIQANRETNTNAVRVAYQDQNDDLHVWRWNGAMWTQETAGLPISTNLETGTNHAVEPFALVQYPPAGISVAGTTAVGLTSFEARPGDASVTLEWRTGSELDNLGFHLWRGPSAGGPWTRVTSSLVPGLGSSPLGQAYSWLDAGLQNGVRYHYRLEDVDTASRSTFHGPVSAVPAAGATTGPGGSGGGEDGAEGGEGTPGATSCPAWVLAAAPEVPSPTCTRHGDPDSVSLDVLAGDASGATLELRTGGFWALREPSGTVRVLVPGMDHPSDPTAPALPLRRALVDAVVGRRVELVSAEALEVQSFRGLRPSAVGAADMAVGVDGTVRPSRRSLPPPVVSRGYVPAEVARLAGTAFQGEKKSAVVEITPVRFAGSRREIVLARRVRVRLAFEGEAAGEIGRGSRGRALPRRGERPREVLALLHTSRRGLHAVRYEEVFPRSLPGSSTTLLRLQRQGEAVPFHVEPAGSSFGPGGVLYFYADRTAASTDYSGEVAYELARASGLRMEVVRAWPAGAPVASPPEGLASFETNRIYQPGLLQAPDVWLWEAMVGGNPPRAVSLALPGVDAASGRTARLAVDLQGGSESGALEDHHVRVTVNGVAAGEARFAGKSPHRLSASVPASALLDGTNTLELVNVGDTGVHSLVFLDKVTVSYPRVPEARNGAFEGTWAESGTVEVGGVTAVPAVVEVTPAGAAGAPAVRWIAGYATAPGAVRFQAEAGRRYGVVSPEGLLSPRVGRAPRSTLRDGANRADYLVIAPRVLLEAARPLLERREDQGLASRAVAFEEIASEFGRGQPSAEAIRAFLSYAYHSWQRPSPRYVLLLGDATDDPQRFLATSSASPLPASWTRTSYLWTASDPALAAVNGDDALPDLAIGRLPATTLAEAEALVGKVLAWEDSGHDLAADAVLVADDPDAGGDFEADVEDVRASVLSGRPTRVLKLRELGSGTREAIRDAWNDGAGVMSYVGHGGSASWASENVWTSWEASSLLAQSRQPVLLTMNCLNGYFVAPSFDSLGEAMVKAEGRGAIAAFSPSGLSLDGPAHQYHRAVVTELVGGRHERLGDAVLAAQEAYARTGLMPELLGVYQLIGDPATKIR